MKRVTNHQIEKIQKNYGIGTRQIGFNLSHLE